MIYEFNRYNMARLPISIENMNKINKMIKKC